MSDVMQELLNSTFQDKLNGVYTAIPCIVIGVVQGLETQMVNIQLSINQRFKDGTVKQRPPILGVPVQFPVSSSAGLTFPINKGDTGLAIFSMRSLDAWKAGNGYPSAPLTFAKYDKGDAVFCPGIQPPSIAVNNPNKRLWQHSTSDCVLVNNIGRPEEAEVRIKLDGTIQINTNSKVEVNCSDATISTASASVNTDSLTVNAQTTVWTGDIDFQGNFTSTGTMTFGGVDFSTHVHGTSPPPSNP